METAKNTIKTVNGVNVTQLFDTIEAIRENPEISKFKFRATNTWKDSTHNQATVKSFYGALHEDNSRTPLLFDIDEPPVLLGENQGANPVEYLLVGLSGCLTTALVAHAAARGIEVKSVQSRLEGDLDVQGFLGLSDTIPVAYQEIRISFKIEANITDQEKQELVEMAQKYSPVFNTVTRPVTVKVGLDRS
jgi:uncharacterized OsmC-like protein